MKIAGFRLMVACALSAVAFGSIGPRAIADDPPKLRAGHPRIYVTPETLAALRQKVKTVGRADFATMHKAAWIMKQAPGTTYSHINNLPYPALCWLISGERKYLDKTRAFLDAFCRDAKHEQYRTPEQLRAAAMAYDWIHAELTPEERKRFAAGLLAMARFCDKLWKHPPFCNHFVNESLAALWAGVALAGDGIADAEADKLLRLGYAHLKSAHAAANEMAGADGGQFEGFSYNDWGYARPLAYTFEMWRTATGEDLFADSTFFKTQPAWHAHCRRPDTGAFVRAEDCPSGYAPGENLRNFMALLAARYTDPLAQWLADSVTRKYEQNFWMDLLWRDYALKAQSPKELNLPTSKLFAKLGWVAMRSAWDDENATFALFQCQDFYAGHQHLDANSFVIHRAGSLAIDSGTNDYGRHRGNYYCRSVAHNTMLFYDAAEKFGGGAWGGGGQGGSNDGGQLRPKAIERVGQFRPMGPNDIASLLAYKRGRHYVYVAGDATRAYAPAKLKEFTRQFIFLPPSLFVIYDRALTAKADVQQKWVIHSINEPRLAPGNFTLHHRRGTLFGTVLMPLGARLTKVGGPGREHFVDGEDYPPAKKPDAETGGWRVEVSAAPGRESRLGHYLVVLTALAPGELQAVTPRGGGDDFHVDMSMLAQGKHYLLKLPRRGPIGGQLTIREKNANGRLLESVSLIAGVKTE